MFFKNLAFFRFPATIAWHAAEHLQAMMAECAARPVGATELQSQGWTPPFGRGHEALFHQVRTGSGAGIWITLGGERRILPPSVVNEAAAKRIAEIEDQEGRRLGGRARKRVKEDVVAELLPRALVRPSRLNAYLDLARGFIAVDTSSRKAAENLVSELRHTLGSFPALPLNAEVSARAALQPAGTH